MRRAIGQLAAGAGLTLAIAVGGAGAASATTLGSLPTAVVRSVPAASTSSSVACSPVASDPTSGVGTAAVAQPSSLAFTGANVSVALLVALNLLAGGLAFVLLSRRSAAPAPA